MKDNFSAFSPEYKYVLNFVSQCAAEIHFEAGDYFEEGQSKLSRIFFSSRFLASKKWSVVPLWHVNLSRITDENGQTVNLISQLKSRAAQSQSNSGGLYCAMIEDTQKLWYSDFSTFAIAGRRNEISENWEDFFSIRATGTKRMGPYMGTMFFWTDDERFVIFSDGDNLAFIAGELSEVEQLLGVDYKKCRASFIWHNSKYGTIPDLYLGLIKFCDDQLKI